MYIWLELWYCSWFKISYIIAQLHSIYQLIMFELCMSNKVKLRYYCNEEGDIYIMKSHLVIYGTRIRVSTYDQCSLFNVVRN
jgi:hypothetical protein